MQPTTTSVVKSTRVTVLAAGRRSPSVGSQRWSLRLKPHTLYGWSKYLRGSWQNPVQLSKVEARGNSVIEPRSGIYVVSRNRSLNRAISRDPLGILYIGKAVNLRSRLRSFLYGSHGATGFLWTYLGVCRAILNASAETEDALQSALEAGYVRCAFVNQRSIARAEQIALFAYYRRFGEFPPLNSSMPNRWEPPTDIELEWATPMFELNGRADPLQKPG